MDYGEILNILAPCGLNCERCFAFSTGQIRANSLKSQELLGCFDIYAERFSAFLPVFKNYPQFKELLAYFAQADCLGCRKRMCKNPNCGVIGCYNGKGVDFCFQCNEFPCDKTNFDPHLYERWMRMNERMRQIGVEAFYEVTKGVPRYGELGVGGPNRPHGKSKSQKHTSDALDSSPSPPLAKNDEPREERNRKLFFPYE